MTYLMQNRNDMKKKNRISFIVQRKILIIIFYLIDMSHALKKLFTYSKNFDLPAFDGDFHVLVTTDGIQKHYAG